MPTDAFGNGPGTPPPGDSDEDESSRGKLFAWIRDHTPYLVWDQEEDEDETDAEPRTFFTRLKDWLLVAAILAILIGGKVALDYLSNLT